MEAVSLWCCPIGHHPSDTKSYRPDDSQWMIQAGGIGLVESRESAPFIATRA